MVLFELRFYLEYQISYHKTITRQRRALVGLINVDFKNHAAARPPQSCSGGLILSFRLSLLLIDVESKPLGVYSLFIMQFLRE